MSLLALLRLRGETTPGLLPETEIVSEAEQYRSTGVPTIVTLMMDQDRIKSGHRLARPFILP